MVFPERFSNLPDYAFPRLRALLDGHAPGGEVLHMTIGEPKHAFPAWVTEVIVDNAAGFDNYPAERRQRGPCGPPSPVGCGGAMASPSIRRRR